MKDIFRFRITLKNTAHPVWRLIDIDNCATLWDLHVAIKDCFGWQFEYQHTFYPQYNSRCNTLYGASEHIESAFGTLCNKESINISLKDFFQSIGDSIHYRYENGEGYELFIKLIDWSDFVGQTIPLCVGGDGFPPCEIVQKRLFDKVISWINELDPEHEIRKLVSFDCREILFTDPGVEFDAVRSGDAEELKQAIYSSDFVRSMRQYANMSIDSEEIVSDFIKKMKKQ